MRYVLAIAILIFTGAASANQSGIYWVPVQSRLSRYAVFDLNSITVRKSETHVSIDYALPRELTGELNYMSFEGPVPPEGQPLVLEGLNGSVICPGVDDLLMCETRYRNLTIDAVKRSEFLRQISRSELELQIREAIARTFCVSASGGEPCGLLRVYTPKNRRPSL